MILVSVLFSIWGLNAYIKAGSAAVQSNEVNHTLIQSKSIQVKWST